MTNFRDYDLLWKHSLCEYDKLHEDKRLRVTGEDNDGDPTALDGFVFLEDVQEDTDFAIAVLLEGDSPPFAGK